MLYYDISYHFNGNLYLRLTDSKDIAGKELSPNAVYTEIAKKDNQRPTKEVVLLTGNEGDTSQKEINGFVNEFNERHQTRYKYQMRVERRQYS